MTYRSAWQIKSNADLKTAQQYERERLTDSDSGTGLRLELLERHLDKLAAREKNRRLDLERLAEDLRRQGLDVGPLLDDASVTHAPGDYRTAPPKPKVRVPAPVFDKLERSIDLALRQRAKSFVLSVLAGVFVGSFSWALVSLLAHK